MDEHGSGDSPAGGVSLWCLSSCDGWSWLVVGPVAEHGVEDVDASSVEADEGGVVFLPSGAFPVVVGAGVGVVEGCESGEE